MENSGTLLGYLRVSTGKQDEQLQHDALDAAGVLKRNRYVDHGISGTKVSRPGLDDLLADAQPGDTIVVYKLDRIGRSAAHVMTLLTDLTGRGIHVRSIGDGLDTTTTTGKAMLGMLAVFAEMERAFIQERTLAGVAAKRALGPGHVGGRPKVTDSKQAAQAQDLRDSGHSVPDIAKALRVSIPTVYRITKSPTRPV
jgi:DNA invertase Pin-like site-specific DNA recombinase